MVSPTDNHRAVLSNEDAVNAEITQRMITDQSRSVDQARPHPRQQPFYGHEQNAQDNNQTPDGLMSGVTQTTQGTSAFGQSANQSADLVSVADNMSPETFNLPSAVKDFNKSPADQGAFASPVDDFKFDR